ncbi:MAG: tetratricopeptide repeat protein [Burkholderiales bacterium]|nr:tetratricopeptide repeat protein [Burkholderiales bacterium]
MRPWVMALLSPLLAACAAAPVAQHDAGFFHDSLFRPASTRIAAADVFAPSPEMVRYAEQKIVPRARVRGRQLALVDALYTSGELKLEYDSESTRNAAQAFAARSGNCLSLVIMTAAFARELGLVVEFQKVTVDDVWARSGDVYMAIGHVNLTLGRRRTDDGGTGVRVGARPHESEGVTVDFLPPDDMRAMRTRPIGEDVIVGMYLNNRAVEALARDELDDAYWWAREAIVQAPGFLVPYNTLGALYQRHGNPREAEPVLRHVLAQEPANTQAMSNLVSVLHALGRDDEAQHLAATLDRIDPEPPFLYFKRGMAALRVGDLAAAKGNFAKEVARAPDSHEFHYWLAIAYSGLGEVEPARAHMAIALENSTTRREHDLYAAKLARLKQAH